MKIAAIGNEGCRKALASKKFNPGVEWAWVENIELLEQHGDAVLYADLDFTADEVRIGRLSRLPGPVLINSVIHDLAAIDGIGGVNGIDALSRPDRPFIRINGWPGLLEREPCELAVKDREAESAVGKLFDSLGWPCRFAPDIPGMISSRILATIINEAWFTLQDGVSTKEEIDEAMRLGTHYPFGPFEWGRRIGLGSIYELLGVLARGNDCYIPAEAMKEELREIKI
jgi:3-hydroxybutyryl-CoA dehydrogenase